MTHRKKILTTLILALTVPSSFIKTIDPSSQLGELTSPFKPTDSNTTKKTDVESTTQSNQEKPTISSWGSYIPEVAIAGTTIVGSAALLASGGALIGAGYGWYTGAIGAGALSGATLTGIVGAGCGFKVAIDNFDLDEKSTYSRLAYQAGIATFFGTALGGASAVFLPASAIQSAGVLIGIEAATGVNIGTTIAIASALGFFYPTTLQEIKDNCK